MLQTVLSKEEIKKIGYKWISFDTKCPNPDFVGKTMKLRLSGSYFHFKWRGWDYSLETIQNKYKEYITFYIS